MKNNLQNLNFLIYKTHNGELKVDVLLQNDNILLKLERDRKKLLFKRLTKNFEFI